MQHLILTGPSGSGKSANLIDLFNHDQGKSCLLDKDPHISAIAKARKELVFGTVWGLGGFTLRDCPYFQDKFLSLLFHTQVQLGESTLRVHEKSYLFESMPKGYLRVLTALFKLVENPDIVMYIEDVERDLDINIQRNFLYRLSTEFPEARFQVTTNSPHILASLAEARVLSLPEKTESSSNMYRGLPVGKILTSHFKASSEVDAQSTEILNQLQIAVRAGKPYDEIYDQLKNRAYLRMVALLIIEEDL